MKKMLIVYYSWSNGNTERIAKQLQSATGADIAQINTVTPYPKDYNATVDQGQRETENGFLPPIQAIYFIKPPVVQLLLEPLCL